MSGARTFDVICVGRAAVDLYGEQTGGRLEDMLTFAKYLGGSPANTAVGCARLGLRPAMLTRVGDEHNGRFVRETLAAEGVDVSHVATDPRRLTALVFLGLRDQDTFPLLFYRDNCADMAIAPEDFDAAFIAAAKALLLSGTHLSTQSTYDDLPYRDAFCARGGHPRCARHRLPPGAVGSHRARLGREAVCRVGPRERASADGCCRLRPHRRHRGGDPHRRRRDRHDRGAADIFAR